MKSFVANLRTAAIVSFIVVLPFALLEFTFNTVAGPNVFGLALLFGFLWLLSTGFILVMLPVFQNVRAGKSVFKKPFNLFLRIACSAVIATVWVTLVIDQLPCFLGVPNCD